MLTVLIPLAIQAASAETFRPNLTQYGHLSWRLLDGAVAGAVFGIAQTKDGYLWIATDGGLERFDGRQFQPWTIPGNQVAYSLLAARDGSLWVGTGRGVVHVDHGRSDLVKNLEARTNAFVEERDGSLWLVRTRIHDRSGPLCHMKGGSVRCYGAADGIQCPFGATLTQDRDGRLWLGGASGVCSWRAGESRFFPVQNKSLANLEAVTAVAARPDGSILAGYIRPGADLGLQSMVSGKSTPFRADGIDGAALAVTTLLVDREGGIWIGTDQDGIYHVAGGRADHFTTADGLTSDSVQSFYEDREGSIWVGTISGLDQFHRLPIAPFSLHEGLSSEQVASVLAARDGAIWIASTQGIDVLRDGKVSYIRKRDGLPGEAATGFFEDRAGRIWAGVDDDLVLYSGGRFTPLRKPDGGPLGTVMQLAQDANGDVWVISVGRPYRLYRIRADRFLDEVHLPAMPARPIAYDRDGTIVVPLKDGRIARYRGGRLVDFGKERTPSYLRELVTAPDGSILGGGDTGIFRGMGGTWAHLGVDGGLPCENVLGMVFDKTGSLWLRLQCGIAIIDAHSLADFWLNRSNRVAVTLLDVTDGARPGSPSFTPEAARAPDGKLWFATDGVLLVADPADLQTNTQPPPVHVESIVADHRLYPAAADARLPPLTRDVEIDYSGLSFVVPQKVRYRYRMLGLDESWQDVGPRRAAFFMNLSPGTYIFQVKASNNDGVWSPVGDSIRFTILPAFYQTLWFRLAAAAAVVVLLWLAFTMRLRYVTSQVEARLSERQAERVRIARELHDTLLQGFHGLMARFQVVANAAGEPTSAKLEEILERADQLLVQSRDRVRDLRSADEGGSPLSDALQSLAFRLERDGSVPIDVVLGGTPVALNSDVHYEVLAIAKEALTNACRHASATAIRCELTYTRSHLLLTCTDNGRGIDPAVLRAGGRDGHWGLSGMEERAREIGATLRIRSNPAQGTKIELKVKARIAYSVRRPGAASVLASIRKWLREIS